MFQFNTASLLTIFTVSAVYSANTTTSTTTWTGPSEPASFWDITLNWDNDVPNAAGVRAVFPLEAVASDTVSLNSTAFTVGSLVHEDDRPLILNSGQLVFDQAGPGGDAAELIVGPTAGGQLDLMVDILLLDDFFAQPVGAGNTIEFAGAVTGIGNITVTGQGSVRFASDADGWSGMLTVDSGRVSVAGPSALGASGPVFLNGGITTLDDAGSYAISPTIADAILQVSQSVTLTSPINTVAGTTATIAESGSIRRGGLVLDGGVVGPGSLNLEVASGLAVNGALSQDGGLQIIGSGSSLVRVDLNAASSYRGQTTLNGVRGNASTPQALGDSLAGTSLVNGSILRISGQSTEPIMVHHSELVLTGDPPDGLSPLTPVTLGDGGVLSVDSFRGGNDFRFNLPITLAGEDALISSNGEKVSIDGGIVGSGSLRFGSVDINSTIALSEGSVLTGAMTFNLADAYDGVIRLGSSMGPNSGRVVANADQQFAKLELFRGELHTAPGTKLRADQLKLRNGEIDGDIVDDGLLQIFPTQTLTFKSLGDFSGQIEVFRGAIGFGEDNPLGSSDTTVRLSGLRESEIAVDLSDTFAISVANSIDLNNKHGLFGRGAIRVLPEDSGTQSLTLSGSLHLGDRGATLGGTNGRLHLAGPVLGGDLAIIDNFSHSAISSSNLAYTGVTRLRNTNASLIGDASLSETSTIELSHSRFNLESSSIEGVSSDRIDDSLTVQMSSAELHHLTFNVDVPVTESIGLIDLKRGFNTVSAINYYDSDVGPSSFETSLILEDVARAPGSVLDVGSPDSSFLRHFMRNIQRGSVILSQPPALRNGLLPGWIQVNNQYATLGPNNEIQPIELPDGDINAVSATGNIRIRDDQVMTADRSVNALRIFERTTLDLGGYQLTLESGAIELGFQGSQTQLTNGSLIIGQEAGQEFIFILRGGAVLDAQIVDNAQPFDVVYADGGIDVRTAQTYSGKTYLSNASLRVQEHGAVPIGGDIDIISGQLVFEVNGVQEFGNVLIADEGALTTGYDAAFLAESLTFESGSLGVPLAGDFIVRKIGPGIARLTARNESPDFTGDIHVEDGLLVFERGDIFADKTIQVLGGAVNSGAVTVDTDIELRGGGIQAGRFNNVTVFSDSRIYGVQAAGDLIVKANQKLTIDTYSTNSTVFATGQIVLEPGATLSGSGRVGNLINLTDATVDPGPSSETLQVHSLTLGPNGRYRFSINDIDGDAGAPFGLGWDLILSDEQINISATQQDPFVIELLMQDLLENTQALNGFDVTQRYTWAIAEGASIDGYDQRKFKVDTTSVDSLFDFSSSQFVVERIGNQLLLIHATTVEPTVGDLDGDGDVDDADFGLAFAAFTGPDSGPPSNPAADIDGDGDVDDADFGLTFAAFTGPGGEHPVPADLDADGDVDDADFGLAFAAFSGPGVPTDSHGDLDGDGDVDDADFGLAFAAFTGPRAAANVPEPQSLALLALALTLATRHRPR